MEAEARAVVCEKCGQELEPGDWPFCPHDTHASYNFILKGEGWTPKGDK